MASMTQEAIAALRAGNKGEGRRLLKRALEAGEPPAPIWYAFALAADSSDERRIYLQKTLEFDPLHEDARRELASLTTPPATAATTKSSSPAKPLFAGEGEAAASARALGAPAKKGTSPAVVLILLILGSCAIFAMLSGGGGSSGGGRSPAVSQPDKYGAWDVCKQQVTSQLKAPSTAKFPRVTDSEVIATTADNKKWAITGYVDAENSFGAMIRSEFVCEATHTSGTNWRVRATLIE